MLIVLSRLCDREMARSSDPAVIARFLAERRHALKRLEVWDNHPAHPGATGIRADKWLGTQPVQPQPNGCTHRHTMMMHFPYDHLLCLDCGRAVDEPDVFEDRGWTDEPEGNWSDEKVDRLLKQQNATLAQMHQHGEQMPF